MTTCLDNNIGIDYLIGIFFLSKMSIFPFLEVTVPNVWVERELWFGEVEKGIPFLHFTKP